MILPHRSISHIFIPKSSYSISAQSMFETATTNSIVKCKAIFLTRIDSLFAIPFICFGFSLGSLYDFHRIRRFSAGIRLNSTIMLVHCFIFMLSCHRNNIINTHKTKLCVFFITVHSGFTLTKFIRYTAHFFLLVLKLCYSFL